MSPEGLAALHRRCFTRPRPWTAAEFAGLLGGAGVVLLEASAEGAVSSRQERGGEIPPAGDAGTAPSSRADPAPGPAGFLLGRVVAGEAEVLTLAVDPGARRRGLGAALVAAFLAEARARGAERAFLEVAEDNPGARGLYTRAGFAVVGRRRGYAGPGTDALTMARDVLPAG